MNFYEFSWPLRRRRSLGEPGSKDPPLVSDRPFNNLTDPVPDARLRLPPKFSESLAAQSVPKIVSRSGRVEIHKLVPQGLTDALGYVLGQRQVVELLLAHNVEFGTKTRVARLCAHA